jgi:hypothetical protein
MLRQEKDNKMDKLFGSKLFWTAVIDALVGLAMLVIGEFFPQHADFARQFWTLLQPLVVAILAVLFGEELKAEIRSVRSK